MGAGTSAGDDTNANYCGIAYGHAYSIITVFQMELSDSSIVDMIMLRNPWGSTYYNRTWSSSDPNWTDALVN